MNLTLIFSIIFGVLVINCQSEGSPSPSSTSEATTISNEATTTLSIGTTSTGSPSDGSTLTTGSAVTTGSPGTSESPGTTESPGPSSSQGSTQSPGPTQSTLTPPSQGPSQNPTVPTTIPPVVPTTEAPLTTQADVWAEFDLDCNTTDNYCVYKINAPQLNAAQYNEDNSKLQTDKNLYLGISSKAYYDSSSFFANAVYQDYLDVQEMVKNLTLQMQALRDIVDGASNDVQNQTAYITEAYQNIKAIYSNLTTCYYQKCANVPPPPITTTTTPRPTTSSVCGGYSCNYPSGEYNGSCNVVSGKPTCQCAGNLDQKNNCEKVSCYSSLSGLLDGMVPGPFWSPGYTSGSTPITSYANKLNCIYKITSKVPLKIIVNKTNLDPTATLLVNGKAVPPTLSSNNTKMQDYLNGIIKSNTLSVTITFKTAATLPTSNGPFFIDWNFDKY